MIIAFIDKSSFKKTHSFRMIQNHKPSIQNQACSEPLTMKNGVTLINSINNNICIGRLCTTQAPDLQSE